MGKVIAIASGKGGSGKTTFTVNLGSGLASLGKRVLLIDENNGLRNLEIAMGLGDKTFFNFMDYLQGKCSLKKASVKDERFQCLYVVPAAQICNENSLNANRIKEVYDEFKDKFDYILIDTPCGVGNGFYSSISGIDEAILITSPEAVSVRNTDKIKSILLNKDIRDIKLIINKMDSTLTRKGAYMSVADIDDLLGLTIIGKCDYDINFPLAFNRGESLIGTQTKAGKNILKICERITGGKKFNLFGR